METSSLTERQTTGAAPMAAPYRALRALPQEYSTPMAGTAGRKVSCRQAVRFSLPRYFSTWSGHMQACVQDWPSCNRGVFPAVDHDRSRT